MVAEPAPPVRDAMRAGGACLACGRGEEMASRRHRIVLIWGPLKASRRVRHVPPPVVRSSEVLQGRPRSPGLRQERCIRRDRRRLGAALDAPNISRPRTLSWVPPEQWTSRRAADAASVSSFGVVEHRATNGPRTGSVTKADGRGLRHLRLLAPAQTASQSADPAAVGRESWDRSFHDLTLDQWSSGPLASNRHVTGPGARRARRD